MTTEQQQNLYIQIPQTIYNDTNLNRCEKLFYGELASLSYKDGYCWASDAYLAQKTGLNIRSIKRKIRKLENAGYIERVTETHLKKSKRRIYPLFQDSRYSRAVNPKASVKNEIAQDVQAKGHQRPLTEGHKCPTTRTSLTIEKDNVPPTPRNQGRCCSLSLSKETEHEPERLTDKAKLRRTRQKEELTDTQDCVDRFKLSEEQKTALEWLSELEGLGTSIGTLCWWAKNYTIGRLFDVYEYARKHANKSIGALMNKLLKSEAVVDHPDTQKNRSWLIEIKERLGWNSLSIKKKYATIETPAGSVHELSFNLPYYSFGSIVKEKYEAFVAA